MQLSNDEYRSRVAAYLSGAAPGSLQSGSGDNAANLTDEQLRAQTSDLGLGVDKKVNRGRTANSYARKEAQAKREASGKGEIPYTTVNPTGMGVDFGQSNGRTANSGARQALQDKKTNTLYNIEKSKAGKLTWDNVDSVLENARGIFSDYASTINNHYGERTDLTEDDKRHILQAGGSILGDMDFEGGLEGLRRYGTEQETKLRSQTDLLRGFMEEHIAELDPEQAAAMREELDKMDEIVGSSWRQLYGNQELRDIETQRNALEQYIAEQEKAQQEQQLYADRQASIKAARSERQNIENRLSEIDELLTFGTIDDERRAELEQEKQQLLSQRQTAQANVEQAEKAVEWDGRQEMIGQYAALQKEWQRLQQSGNLEDIVKSNEVGRQMLELRDKIRQGDMAVGNGARDYTFADRAGGVYAGTAANLFSSLYNAGATMADAYHKENAYGQERYNLDLMNDQNRALQEQTNAQLAQSAPEFMTSISGTPQTAEQKREGRIEWYESEPQREKYNKMYQVADNFSEASARELQLAKEGLSELGQAGVDIAQNVLEMGFDAAVGTLTGGGSLASMYARTFGGSAQEARQAGADLEQQLQYGGAKAAIEVLTEKLFDGVAGVYGKGGADEITEALIGKLADSDIGRTFLRVVLSGAGEGIEEVISSMLSPLAEALYKDESIRELYGQINPADVLYDFIIGAAIGALGGGTSIATGQNAQRNLDLRLNDAGMGDVNSQVNSAFSVLSGRNTADEVRSRENTAKARLADQVGGRNALGGLYAIEDYVNQRRLSQYDNVGPASQPATAEQRQAWSQVSNIINSGEMSEETARQILADPKLKAAAEYLLDTTFNDPDPAVNAQWLREFASDSRLNYSEPFNQQNAARDTRAAEQAELASLTPEQRTERELQNLLSGTVTNSVATRILTDPNLRAALERMYPNLNLQGLTAAQARNAIKTLNAQPAAETAPTPAPAPAPTQTETQAPTPAPQPTAQTGQAGQTQGAAPQGEQGGIPSGVPGGLAPWDTTTAEATNGMGKERERNMARNLRGNENAEAELRASFEQNRETYTQLTNNEVTVKAEAITGKGFEAAKEAVYRAIERAQSGMKLAPEYAVAGYHLANEMTRRGDIEGARALASSIAAELTYAGQLGQIGRVILNMDPSVRIMTVDKIMSKMNDSLSKAQKRKVTNRAKSVAKNMTAQGTTEAVTAAKASVADTISNAMSGEQFGFADEAAKKVAESIKNQIKNSLAPAKPANTLDTFVNYVKKFAREKVNIGSKTKAMTATEFLSEVVNNEDLMREVYEKAQAEFAKENGSGYREFVQDYLNTPMGLDTTDPRNKIFARAIAESALATGENNARYIREQEALGVPRSEIADRIANDLIQKTGASGAIADSIREAASNYVTQTVQGGEATSEAQVERLVSNVMRDLGEKFRDLAVQDNVTRDSLSDAIAGEIASVYALSPESAEQIASTIANQYSKMLTEAIQAELQRRFAPKEKQSRQVKEFAQQLTEAINLGAFDSEYAQNAIQKLFGVEGEINVAQDLLDQYANAQTDEEADAALDAIKNDIARQIPATFRDKFTALRYLNMLGNLKTQGRNIIGNTLMMGATDVKRTVQAVTELAAAAVTGGKYERTTSLTTDAKTRRQANEVFDKNVDDIKGESKYSDVAKQSSRDIMDRVTIFGSGESNKWASELLSKALGRDVDVKKNVIEDYRLLTNWAMDAGDVIFMRHTFNRAYAGWMNAHGIKDISQASQEQQNRAYEFAKKEAQEATFHDSNKFSEAVSRFGRGQNSSAITRALSEGVMPFRKTPANVAVRAVEYSPLGFLKTLWDITGHMGNNLATDKEGNVRSAADIINEASKSLTGTALATAGYFLAAAGKARASGDDEDEDLNFFHKMQGASDYSVKIGDRWFSLSQFAPMSIPFFMGAKLFELLDGGTEDLSLDDFWDIIGVVSDPMLEMSMLSGVNDLFEDMSNLNGDTGAIPALVINAGLGLLSQGLTNSVLGQLEQASEENRMTTYVDKKSEDATAWDRFLGGLQYKVGQYSAKTPGWEYHQEEYVDAWGRTQSNGSALERYANALANPTYITQDRSTEVDAELERLHTENRDVEGFPSVLPEKRGRNETVGKGIVMTPEQYHQFSIESGQKKLELVSDFMNSEEYAGLSDMQRAEVISNLYTLAEDLALRNVKEGYGVKDNSSTAKLLAGSRNGDGEKVPALQENNLAEYVTFETVAADMAKSGDYSGLQDLYTDFYGGLDDNTKSVMEAKNTDGLMYARLLAGVEKPGDPNDVEKLAPENIAEYARYNAEYSEARNNRDYAALDQAVAAYAGLDANTQKVIEDKGFSNLKDLLAFSEAGVGSESYFTVRDSITDEQWNMDVASSQGGHVRLAGLANADIPDAEKDALVSSGAFKLSGTARSTYQILRDYGLSPEKASEWFENADWSNNQNNPEPSANGSLNAYEVAVGISRIPGLSDSQRNSMYAAFKAAIQKPNDAYDTWKNKSYTKVLRQANDYGRTVVGRPQKDALSEYAGL